MLMLFGWEMNKMEKIDRLRLIASEGMLLTDGVITATCVDIAENDLDKWSEIENTAKEEENLEEKEA